MALMNSAYLKATLNGFIGMRVEACAANAREARTLAPIALVSKLAPVITHDVVEEILEDVRVEVDRFKVDIYAGNIAVKRVGTHYVVNVILYS
jgi:hypothetical protein